MRYIVFTLLCLFTLHTYSQYYVHTYSGSTSGFANGDTATARFAAPAGMCTDRLGNKYIADAGNNRIRKIDPTGLVATLAGTGTAGYHDGRADSAMFDSPWGVYADDSLNVYVSDFNNQRIRKITPAGYVITIAGNGTAGLADGRSDTAQFDYPRGLCMDKHHNLYVADSWNHRIRRISPQGIVSTYAGSGTTTGVQTVGSRVDSDCANTTFYTPCGLTIDPAGNIYVADAYNHAIRRIDTACRITTLCGGQGSGTTGGSYVDGSFAIAAFNTPTELTYDSATHSIIVSDLLNARIRILYMDSGKVATMAGSGAVGSHNGRSDSATFDHPRGIIRTHSGIYICDANNNRLRTIRYQSNIHTGLNPTLSDQIVKCYIVNGILHISTPFPTAECSVVDLLGKTLLSYSLQQAETEIDITSLSSQLLYVCVRQGGDSYITRVFHW